MKQLSKKILEAINTGVRIGLSLDDFDDMDDKLPTLKKDIKSKSENNLIKIYQSILEEQCKNLKFDKNIKNILKYSKDNNYAIKYTPENNYDLVTLLYEFFAFMHSYNCDLNWIDTSKIKDMTNVFSRNCFSKFNGDISKWDVSNVEKMSYMFSGSQFNGDISKWNVSNVIYMYEMFRDSKFNKDISKWNVSSVKNMDLMFYRSKFNQDISNWDVSSVETMDCMFLGSKFNGDISKWDVSHVKNMKGMFKDCKFNGDISKWDVSNVEDMSRMFEYNGKFNRDLRKWDVSKVEKADFIFNKKASTVKSPAVYNLNYFKKKNKKFNDFILNVE